MKGKLCACISLQYSSPVDVLQWQSEWVVQEEKGTYLLVIQLAPTDNQTKHYQKALHGTVCKELAILSPDLLAD